MNRYIMIRRLRLPAIVLLAGTIALLDTMGVVDHFWRLFVPLLLILLGVCLLAERVALAAEGGFPTDPYSCWPYAGTQNVAAAAPAYPGQPVAQTPPQHQETGTNSEGGQL